MRMSSKKNKNNKKGVSRSRNDNGNEHGQEEKAEKEDKDKLWCICTICHAAFEDDLSSFKKHRVNKCGSKGLILSKEDLSPWVALTRFNNNNESSNSINPSRLLSANPQDSRPTKKKSKRISSGSDGEIDYSVIPLPIPLKIESTTTSVAPLHNVDVDDDCDGDEEGLFDNHDYNDDNDDAVSGTGSCESNDDPTTWSNLYPDIVLSNNETNDEPALMMKQEIQTHIHDAGQINEVEDQVVVEAERAQNTKIWKGRSRSKKSAAPSSQRPSDNNTNLNLYETNESLAAQASKLFNVGVLPRPCARRKTRLNKEPEAVPTIPTATLDFISQALTQPVVVPSPSDSHKVVKRPKQLVIPKTNEHQQHVDTDDDSEEDSNPTNSSSTETKKKERSSFWKDSYPCVFCPCIFKDWRRLKKHLKKFRTSDENPPPQENLSFTNSNDNSNEPEQFSTPLTIETMPTQTSLEGNEAAENPTKDSKEANAGERVSQNIAATPSGSGESPPPRFRCPLCPDGFHKLSIYNAHILTVHPLTPTQHNGTRCRTCSKTFKDLRNLERHVQEIHRTSGLKSFLCSSCGVAYAERKHLNKHILRKHTEVTQHMCGICQRPCYSAKHLQSHLKTHDAPQAQKVHLCAICGFSTSTEQYLRRHMFVHSDARPHKCSQCPSSFKRSEELKKHIEGHSGIIHKCLDCDKIYKRKEHLIRHIKTSHLGLPKSHACTICGSAYELAALLNGHMKRVHGEAKHQCTVCGKSFTLNSKLKQHSVVHESTKKYNCSICGKSFKTRVHLIQHATCHLTEAAKKHVCSFCGARFGLPWLLRQHQAAHHGSKSNTNNIMMGYYTKKRKSQEEFLL